MAELNEQQIMANAQDILAGEKPIMFDKDIRPLIDLINMKIYTALRGAKEGKMAREDEMAAAEGEAPIEPTAEPMPGAGPEGELPEDMMDMTPLIEVLGPEATEDQAMAVYDAAQEMAETHCPRWPQAPRAHQWVHPQEHRWAVLPWAVHQEACLQRE